MAQNVDPNLVASAFGGGGDYGFQQGAAAPTVGTADYMAAMGGGGGGFGDIWKKNIQPLLESGALAQLAGIGLGTESPTGRMSSLIGGQLQARSTAMTQNKLLRSLLSSYGGGAAGKTMEGGVESPFPGSPEQGEFISGITALGMTPDIVNKLFGTAFEQVEKARKAPLEEMTARAGAAQNFAQAYKLNTEAGMMPLDAAMKAAKTMTEIGETKAKTALVEEQAITEKERPARIKAETKYAEELAYAASKEGKAWESNLKKTAEIEVARDTARGVVMSVSGKAVLTNPWAFGATLEAEKKPDGEAGILKPMPPASAANNAWSFTNGIFDRILEQELIKKYDVKKAKDMMDSLQFQMSQVPADGKPDQILKSLSPEMQQMYQDVWDLYNNGLRMGMPMGTVNKMARAMLGMGRPRGGVSTDATKVFESLKREEQDAIANFVKSAVRRQGVETDAEFEQRQVAEMAKIAMLPAEERNLLIGKAKTKRSRRVYAPSEEAPPATASTAVPGGSLPGLPEYTP